jgi:DNA primase
MAKTYLSAVKYNILAEFEVEGIVDKPDIIGAIFGQSEGLLGQEMDLKQLQQNGKIGRIEIDSKVVNGKTVGTIVIPSSMDMVQTSLLAAAIESVDKVGPCESRIKTQKIEDTRGQKRKEINQRAQELLQRFMTEEMPETKIMAENLMASIQTAKLVEYGPERLAAGPEIDSSNEIIVVEGRADVLNLLKNGVTNVIAMEGSKVPSTIIELAKTKTIVAFVDGDRGGELNARHLQEVAKLDFVVRAPDGKEVEELTKKEIVMALRKKNAPEEAFQKRGFGMETENDYGFPKPFGRPRFDRNSPRGGRTMSMRSMRESDSRPRSLGRGRERGIRPMGMRSMGRTRVSGFQRGNRTGGMRFQSNNRDFSTETTNPGFEEGMGFNEREETASEPALPMTPEENKELVPILKQLNGSLKAKLFDAGMKELAETDVRELISKIKETNGTHTVVFDGIITKRLAEEAEKLGVERIVGIKKGWFKPSGKIRLLTSSG